MNNDITIAEVLDAVVHLHGAMDLFATRVDGEFRAVNGRLDRIELRLDGVELRLGGLERRMSGLEDEFRGFRSETNARFAALNG